MLTSMYENTLSLSLIKFEIKKIYSENMYKRENLNLYVGISLNFEC